MGARPLHHAAHVKVLHHVRLVEPVPNHARRTAKIRMPLPDTELLWRSHCQAGIELIKPIERVIQIHVSIWVETALRRTLDATPRRFESCSPASGQCPLHDRRVVAAPVHQRAQVLRAPIGDGLAYPKACELEKLQ